MAEFKKVAVLTLSTLLSFFLGMCPSSAVWAETTIIKSIRTGSDQAYVRVVIETNIRLDPRPTISVSRNTLFISLAGVRGDAPPPKSEAYRNDVISIDVDSTSKGTRIEGVLSFIPIRIRTFFLVDPHRFVADAYRPSSTATNDPSDEAIQPISIIEENYAVPNEINGKNASPQKGEKIESKEALSRASANKNNPDGSSRQNFQQRFLAFLIVVTSIILVVIIFLMCLDRKPK